MSLGIVIFASCNNHDNKSQNKTLIQQVQYEARVNNIDSILSSNMQITEIQGVEKLNRLFKKGLIDLDLYKHYLNEVKQNMYNDLLKSPLSEYKIYVSKFGYSYYYQTKETPKIAALITDPAQKGQLDINPCNTSEGNGTVCR